MSEARPAGPSADHNLLYGILALQMGFVTRDALIAAMQAWVFARDKSLGELLQERGALTPAQRQALDLVAAEHVRARGGDVQRSLAAVGVPSTVQRELESVADAEVQASLTAANGTLVTTELRSPSPVEGMRYAVIRPHARGGLGVVSIARDTELGREVALKEMQAGYAADGLSRGRFVREAEITGGLEHPGVVPVYGLGRYDDGRPYYAMRLIRGETLQEAVRKLHAGEAGYTLRSLLTRFVAVCNALAYAHSRGVIHRDLKPANVMLGPYGETLVVDWGLAKVVGRPEADNGNQPVEQTLQVPGGDGGSATRAGTMLGTPAFMSPEQAAGQLDEQGPATDVYGLGATLYAVLTGRGPITGSDTAKVLEKVRQGNWLPPRRVRPSLPLALDAICRKALALKPMDRYPSALALAADVEHWLADEPVSTWREPVMARLVRWSRRHRTLVTGAAAALLVGVVSLGTTAVLLAAANGRERAAKEVAERQRDRANANFRLAQNAVDHFHTRVSESLEMKARGAENLRTGLLEEAAQFYEQFVNNKEEEDGEEVEAKRGRSLQRLANLLQTVRRSAEAEDHLKQAIAIARRLVDASPAVLEYKNDLAEGLNSLSVLYAELGRGGESEKAALEALDLRRDLAAAGPEDPDYLHKLALSLHQLGTLYDESGRFEKAEKPHSESIDLCRRLEETHPEKPEYQMPRANSLHNLALWYGRKGQLGKAHAASKEARDLFRRMIQAKPDVPVYQRGLANSLWALGFQYSAMTNRAEAEAAYTEAATIFRRLVRSHPAVTDFQRDLSGSLADLADNERSSGHLRDALGNYDEAIRLSQDLLDAEPRLTGALLFLSRARSGRAEALGRLNQPLEAVVEWKRAAESWGRAGELIRRPARAWYEYQQALALLRAGQPLAVASAADAITRQTTNSVSLYNAACHLSLASAAIAKSATLPPFSAMPLSRHYAARAVVTLRQALAADYKITTNLRGDTDLDPIRGRADFKQLLTDMQTNPK